MDTEVSGATSPAAAAGEGAQPPTVGPYCVLKNPESVVTSTSVGPPDQGIEPGAAVTPLGSRSVEAGGDMTSTAASEGPGAGPSVSALPGQGNTGEQGGGRQASQPQAEALRKWKQNTSTRRPSHSGRKLEDKSVLRSHGTPRGRQREKIPTSRSSTQMGSRWIEALPLLPFCRLHFFLFPVPSCVW